MKTYTPKEVEQLLKEQRENCAKKFTEGPHIARFLLEQDILNAPLPSSFQKVEEVEDEYSWLSLFLKSHYHLCVGGTKESEQKAEKIRNKYLEAAKELLHDLEIVTQ